MSAIAITGVSGLVGQCLLPELAATGARIVALDVREPRRRVRALEFHRVDIASAELRPLLEGVDTIVHLASVVDPIPDEALMAHVNVDGTRRVLEAAAAVGVRKVVRVSSATVYGAWPTNPVPLTESAPLRPNPGFSPGLQAAEVERLIAEWHGRHPEVVVTTLRSAPVLGPGAERLPSRLLVGRPPLRIRGGAAPIQTVHVDDLVAALVLAVARDLPGVYNVAANGWLDAAHHRALLGRQLMPPVPAQLAERVLARTWAWGVGEIPPGVVPYLVHPWVLANDRLRGVGWEPRHTNDEALLDGIAALPPRASRVPALLVGLFVGAVLAARRAARRRSRPA